MVEIELIDFKGDYIKILFPCAYKISRAGLIEQWCYVEQDWEPRYTNLPFPVFTDWWDVRCFE